MKGWMTFIQKILVVACYLPIIWVVRRILDVRALIEQAGWSLVPNALTLSRVVLSPFITAAFMYGVLSYDIMWAWAAIVAFAVVSIFDYLDGYLSRLWGVETEFGKKWDPIADKVLVLPLLPALWFADILGSVLVVPAIVIGLREPAVDFLRRWCTWVAFPSSPLAKLKTTMQMLSLGLLMSSHQILLPELWILGAVSFIVASVLTLLTGLDYLARVWGWLDRLIGSPLVLLRVRPQ